MSKNTYSNEVKEKAFLFWYDTRNDSEVVRLLKQAGYSITRTTISSWREKYDWQERAESIDIKKQAAQDVSISFEESLLLDLQKQKERYDVYFDNLPAGKVDNQAMYVYNQLCEKLINQNVEEIKRQILGI